MLHESLFTHSFSERWLGQTQVAKVRVIHSAEKAQTDDGIGREPADIAAYHSLLPALTKWSGPTMQCS